MQAICSYCRKSLGKRPPLDDERVTHGICLECHDYFTKQWAGLTLGEHLDRYDVPVAVFADDVRLVAANRHMAAALGKDDRALFGLLGGEVLECENARLPGGCGKTVCCRDCAIRRSIEETLATGQPRSDVPAELRRDGRLVKLLLSTRREQGAVLVTVHEPKPA